MAAAFAALFVSLVSLGIAVMHGRTMDRLVSANSRPFLSGVVRAQGCPALFNWQRYANDCNGCDLTIRVFASSFETPDERKAGKYFMRFGDEKRTKYEGRFTVTRHPALGVAWSHGGQVITSGDAAGEILSRMIDVLTSR